MNSESDSLARWRKEAERVRALASRMTNPEPRRIMREIAEAYELLASHAARWTSRAQSHPTGTS